ncbi:DEAD/DEAH box helicase family protein [Candidatus Nitrosocosmicus sp. R]
MVSKCIALNLRQMEAIKNLEQSLSDNKSSALIQKATGSGKTYTAVSAIIIYFQHKFSHDKMKLV